MKKCRRSLAAILVMALAFCGCGNHSKEMQTITQENTTQEVTEETIDEVEMPDVEGDPIYIYSYDDTFSEYLKYFYDKYPEYTSRVEFVCLEKESVGKDYPAQIRKLLKMKMTKKTEEEDAEEVESVKYPAIVVYDSNMASTFVQNDFSVTMESIGVTQQDMEQMFPYTVSSASFLNEAKALFVDVKPGCFLYRSDIAKEVFGESEPEKIQQRISDWKGFEKTAEQLRDYDYKILSGADEVAYVMLQQKEIPWVLDETLRIDANVKKCFGLSRELLKGDYTNRTRRNSKARSKSFDGDVFGWFVDYEEVCSGIQTTEHEGLFQVCQGPNPYQWGSDYCLTVTPKCPDKDLATLVLKTLCCDEEVLQKITEEKGILVNHQQIVANLADSNNTGMEMLGGQNPYHVWNDILNKINCESVTPYDGQFDAWIRELSVRYSKGKKGSIDDAMEQFKDQVTNQYNYIFIK